MGGSVESLELLKTLPGGPEVASLLGDDIELGDAEVVSVKLDRHESELVLSLPWKATNLVFVFDHWLDVQLRGFSHQNVIGGLRITKAPERDAGFAEIGLGYIPAEVELRLDPCAGAHGTIAGRVKSIRIEPAS